MLPPRIAYNEGRMIRLRLFRIPVAVAPSLWAALAASALLFGSRSVADVLIFMAASLLCLLLHELGHALVGRALGGGHPVILLSAAGCGCLHADARLSRTGSIITSLAGPLAGLLPALLALLLMAGGEADVLRRASEVLCGRDPALSGAAGQGIACAVGDILLPVSFWWSLFNLLPVIPLDGGRLLAEVLRSPALAQRISRAASCTLALALLFTKLWPFSLLLVCLAFSCRKRQGAERRQAG